MPAALATRTEVIDRLFSVFRERGFEGASLADLSRATGLGRSSLYHYFPDGKEQMAEAVLAHARDSIDLLFLEQAGTLKQRLRRIAAALENFYAGGRNSCVLGQLSSARLASEGRQRLQDAFAHWIEAIEALAVEAGLAPARARHFAEDWVARLQGALILQAANGNTGPFERALDALLALANEEPGRAGPQR